MPYPLRLSKGGVLSSVSDQPLLASRCRTARCTYRDGGYEGDGWHTFYFLARPAQTLRLHFIAARTNEGALPFASFKGWGFFPSHPPPTGWHPSLFATGPREHYDFTSSKGGTPFIFARSTRALLLDFIAVRTSEGALPFAAFKGWGFFPPWFFSGRINQPFFSGRINRNHPLFSCRVKRPTAPRGHHVRLIAPQFVKPYVKSNKNDAEAICEAVSRPHMRFVPAKSVEQQDIQSLHRVRSRLVSSRTKLVNQIRGLLAEYGIVLPQYVSQLRRELPRALRAPPQSAPAPASLSGSQNSYPAPAPNTLACTHPSRSAPGTSARWQPHHARSPMPIPGHPGQRNVFRKFVNSISCPSTAPPASCPRVPRLLSFTRVVSRSEM